MEKRIREAIIAYITAHEKSEVKEIWEHVSKKLNVTRYWVVSELDAMRLEGVVNRINDAGILYYSIANQKFVLEKYLP